MTLNAHLNLSVKFGCSVIIHYGAVEIEAPTTVSTECIKVGDKSRMLSGRKFWGCAAL